MSLLKKNKSLGFSNWKPWDPTDTKGGLISESFSLWLKFQNKAAKSLNTFSSCKVQITQESGTFIWRFDSK